MHHKTFFHLFILGIILLGNIENSNAQFLKKLKDKVSKSVTETVDKISSKKNEKNPHQPNTQNENKETSQTSTNSKSVKQQTQEIDYSDIYTIKSPYPEFKSIHLQAHNDLPRFGSHNPYYFKNRYGGQGVNRTKNTLLTNGYNSYGSLITMHFLESYFKDIDRTSLTFLDRSNTSNTKDIHSNIAQRELLKAAYGLATESIIKTFFCDMKNNSKCTSSSYAIWGGHRSPKDEFEEQEKYTTYVDKHLDKLRKWSKDFFENGTQTGYFVNRHKWGTSYDFDAQGYWTSIFPNNFHKGHCYRFTGEEAFFFEFLPITNYGNKHLNQMTDPNSYYPLILLKMNVEAAEALTIKKPEFVYSATKVKIKFKTLNDSQVHSPLVEFTYHLLNPVIEFFEDIQLTKKIGEITLEKGVYKKRN